MEALLDSLVNFLAAGWALIVEVYRLITSRVPLPLILGLLVWIVFWTFGVNWVKLRETLLKGGAVALVLIGLAAVLVWGTIAPPADGHHSLLGLEVSNYVGKTVYVTALICIMFLCGSIQLSGCCASCCRFEEDEDPDAHAPAH